MPDAGPHCRDRCRPLSSAYPHHSWPLRLWHPLHLLTLYLLDFVMIPVRLALRALDVFWTPYLPPRLLCLCIPYVSSLNIGYLTSPLAVSLTRLMRSCDLG